MDPQWLLGQPALEITPLEDDVRSPELLGRRFTGGALRRSTAAEVACPRQHGPARRSTVREESRCERQRSRGVTQRGSCCWEL